MSDRKPIYRPRNLVAVLLVLFGGWVGYEIYHAVTAKPGTDTDYGQLVHELALSHLPGPEGESWDLLMEAIRLGRPVLDVRELDAILYRRDSHPAYAVAATALVEAEKAGVFEALDELTRASVGLRPAFESPMIFALIPELGDSRMLVKAAAGRMFLARQAGDMDTYVESFEQILAMARTLSHQTFLLDSLVAMACVELALSELRYDLTENPPDGRTCERLVAAMDRHLPLPPYRRALECERMMFMDMLQYTHTSRGRLIISQVGSLSMGATPGWAGHSIANLGAIAMASRAQNEERGAALFDAMIAATELDVEERIEAIDAFHTEIAGLSFRFMILGVIMPAIGKSIEADTSARAKVDQTRTMLAIELYRARHGVYPESLDVLVPDFIDAIPRDLFDPAGPRYRIPDTDPHPRPERTRSGAPNRPYLLYSIGNDGEDNLGRTATPAGNEHEAFQLRQVRVGVDYVFNMPRPAFDED